MEKDKIKISNMSNLELIEAKKIITDFLKFLDSEYTNIKKMEEEKS